MTWRASLTQRRDLTTFRQFLLEDDDEDIVSGLRKLVSDIRTNWRSPYSSVKGEQERFWKKLSPQQQAALRQRFQIAIQDALTNISQPIRLSGFNPSSKIEAQVIYLTFRRMAKDLQHQIGPNFLEFASAGAEPLISREKAEAFKGQYNSGGLPMDRELGPVTLKFVNDHQQLLTRIIMVEDEGAFGFDIFTVPQNLSIALKKTAREKWEEAVNGVHYLLLRMAKQFSEASVQLEKMYAGKNLPDEPPQPGKPPGGISKPAAPVTKP